MHPRPQVSRPQTVTRRARRPGLVTEAPRGARWLPGSDEREGVRSALAIPQRAVERRTRNGRARGQRTSAAPAPQRERARYDIPQNGDAMFELGLAIAIGPALAMMGLAALAYTALTRWHVGVTRPRRGA